MKGKMLKSLETRFDNIEESELLLVSLVWILDLRTNFFTLRSSKKLARKCVIKSVVDTDVEVEPQSKRSRTESSSDSSADNTSLSKVWECFSEFLQDSGATTDSDGGKEAMID